MDAFNALDKEKLAGRILVVDSDPFLSELVHFHFNPQGYEVDTCLSLDDWLLVDTTIYDLIIVDIAIDQNCGIQIIEMLNQSPATARIPVVICTSGHDPASIVNGLNAGASDYITRPFSVAEFVARLKGLLKRARAIRPNNIF